MTGVVKEFKRKTNKLFHEIGGCSADDLETAIYKMFEDIIYMYDLDVQAEEVVLIGSRCRGLEEESSDLDFVVFFTGNEREDNLFNLLNEEKIEIAGIKIDINPILYTKSGQLEDYLLIVEEYLANKNAKRIL